MEGPRLLPRLPLKSVVAPMCWHSVLLFVALFSTGAQAYAPIQAMIGNAKGIAVLPKGFPGNVRGAVTPQKLTISAQLDSIATDRVPYFSAKPDQTISWDDMDDWCLEADGVQRGDTVHVNRCTGGAAQKWNWIPNGQGGNMLQLKDTNMCLDVSEKKSDSNGAAIQLDECERQVTETWKFEEPMPLPTRRHSEYSQPLLSLRNAMMSALVLAGVGVLSLSASVWRRQKQPRAVHMSRRTVPLNVDHGLSMTVPLTPASNRSRMTPAVMATSPTPAEDVSHFDYLVIGGGSGGIGSARRAALHGKKVAVIERERLGGTCVNVGCVPKKVMFNAGAVQEVIHQAAGFGFNIENSSFDLAALKEKRDAYVKRLNGIYATNLEKAGITSITGDAKFVGEREVTVGDKKYTADHVLIAVGGKPLMPDIPGIEHAITSNGFFDLEEIPKKVAVVGSGYIAVELAGILQTLGSEVDLMIRGDLPLRSMDSDIVSLLKEEMEATGIKYVKGEVCELTVAADGTKATTLKSGEKREGYDHVLFAIGRVPVTDSLNLEAAGVQTAERGEIVVDELSNTTAKQTYAVGDIITGGVQLTPVAIAAGRLLSDRLFNDLPESEAVFDYDMVPTVVFSHPPLAVMGLTEKKAIEEYGADNVTIHKSTWVNMMYSREFLVQDGHGAKPPKTRGKLVCVGPEQRVVGLHMIGLNVDEMLQGFGVAIQMGATKADFDNICAIHPTSSEELVTIQPWQPKYSKSSKQ